MAGGVGNRFRRGKGLGSERDRSLHGSRVRPSRRHTYSQQRPAADHRLPGRQGHPGAAVPRLQLKAPGHGGEDPAPPPGDGPRSRFRLPGTRAEPGQAPRENRGVGWGGLKWAAVCQVLQQLGPSDVSSDVSQVEPQRLVRSLAAPIGQFPLCR